MLIWEQKWGHPKNGGLSQTRGAGHVHTKLRIKFIKSSCSTAGNEGAEVQVYYRRQWSLSGCQGWLQGLDQWPEDLTCPQRPSDPVTPVNPVKYLWYPTDTSHAPSFNPQNATLRIPVSWTRGLPARCQLTIWGTFWKFFFRFVSEYHQVHYLKSPCHRFINKLSPFTKSLTGFNSFPAVYKRTDSRSA